MELLPILNTRIATLENSIYSMNMQIERKREELERLKRTQSQLVDYQNDFHQQRNIWNKPELSKATWQGQLANDFQSFRNNELHASYEMISDKQFNDAMTRLENEISTIQQSIGDLQANISTQQSSLGDLREQKRKELTK